MDLSNKIFKLVQNQDGLAASETKMIFSANSTPYTARYSGDNVLCGHVIVNSNNGETQMIYHALTNAHELVAGRASVSVTLDSDSRMNMTLHWQWLTGNLSSGISTWIEADS